MGNYQTQKQNYTFQQEPVEENLGRSEKTNSPDRQRLK
jgi:hypothetical protein